ncbi:MAG: alpha/beta hydrolase [Bacteroidota bacterium]|jgi:pimeloyl-ACP methyl ester carboxylesterase
MNRVTSKDGTSIAYDKLGNGPALILVDGALCSRAFGPMPKLASLLQKNFTVFLYDRRGRGESTDTKLYDVEREVDDIDALLQQAGGSAYVFGISSGAGLIIHAVVRGLNIKKLALYEPPFVAGKNGQHKKTDHESRLKQLIASDRRGDAAKYFMTKMMGAPAIVVFVMQLMPMWSKLKAVAHTLPYDAAVMGDFTVPEARIASIKKPTLIAGGDKSPAALRNAVQQVADALPDGTLRWLKDQTHNVKTEILAPLLTELFQES